MSDKDLVDDAALDRWMNAHVDNPANAAKKPVGRPARPVIDRIMEKVLINETGCWVFGGGLDTWGYGAVSDEDGHKRGAHRVLYEKLIGPIPDGLTLDHLCRNRRCCNPRHLEPVTIKTNLLRGFGVAANNARKTHCRNGHAFDADNTYLRPVSSGEGRDCRICLEVAREKYRSNHPANPANLPDPTNKEQERHEDQFSYEQWRDTASG